MQIRVIIHQRECSEISHSTIIFHKIFNYIGTKFRHWQYNSIHKFSTCLDYYTCTLVGISQQLVKSPDDWAVVVVKWSVCSPSIPTIRVRMNYLMNTTVLSVKCVLKKNKNKRKEACVGPFLKSTSQKCVVLQTKSSYFGIFWGYFKHLRVIKIVYHLLLQMQKEPARAALLGQQ